MKLFKDITIEPYLFENNAYPLIRIIDKIPVALVDDIHEEGEIDEDCEYILLEKYEISRENSSVSANVQKILYYQNVQQYMTTYQNWKDVTLSPERSEQVKWENMYMTTNYVMGGHHLGSRPKYINISNFFSQGMPNYIIDTDTNTKECIYSYRIIVRLSGDDYHSSYVAGVQTLKIEDMSIDKNDEMSLFKGKGTLYREGIDGRIYKSINLTKPNYRYRGPIEKDKYNGFSNSLDSVILDMEEHISKFNDKLNDRFNILSNMGTYD